MNGRQLSENQKKLVTDNIGLVYYWIEKFDRTKNSIQYDEHFSNGTLGLIKAALTYEASKKVAFSTYATRCIYNEILQGIRRERKLDKEVSIIFLTALGDEESEIKGFDLKADDYISKPFSFNILIKRVEAVLRRKQKEEKEDTILEFEGLKLDLQTFKSYIDNEEIELTLKEFNILKLMINSYPTVVSREKLIEKIWGYEYFGDTRVIDAHMKNIRKKIKKDYIKTIKGVGYVLEK